MDRPDQRITAVASLDQPVRRRIFRLFAVDPPRWFTRDQVAEHLGVGRSAALFHLDKLADGGVLEVTYGRINGRVGPGAGRPAKQYRLASAEISASVPARQYDLAGRILADAIAESSSTAEPVADCLRRAADAAGRALAAEPDDPPEQGADDGDRPEARLLHALVASGYEPQVDAGGEIVLGNCPFHRLAEDHRTLVCGMNVDLLAGLLDELRLAPALQPHLEPVPGACCVRIRPS